MRLSIVTLRWSDLKVISDCLLASVLRVDTLDSEA